MALATVISKHNLSEKDYVIDVFCDVYGRVKGKVLNVKSNSKKNKFLLEIGSCIDLDYTEKEGLSKIKIHGESAGYSLPTAETLLWLLYVHELLEVVLPFNSKETQLFCSYLQYRKLLTKSDIDEKFLHQVSIYNFMTHLGYIDDQQTSVVEQYNIYENDASARVKLLQKLKLCLQSVLQGRKMFYGNLLVRLNQAKN